MRPIENKNYRIDIDGLRGIAVLAVVLFHADLGLPGGYLGVDVFFVISGYLITGIIARQLQQSNFRLLQFMVRRIRRIAPAAVVMTSFVLAFGAFVLPPSALDQLATSAFCQQFLLSNVYFYLVSDYFAAPAARMPLLHTWTLSLEEQFYILLPLVLPWVLRRKAKISLWLVWTFTAASFGCYLWASQFDPVAAFFLLPTRAWEFSIGGLLAVHELRRRHESCGQENSETSPVNWRLEVFAASALAMLGYCFRATGSGHNSGGYDTVLAVLGSALLIAIGKSYRSLAHRLLSKQVFVATGLISYSLYLWHWPVFAFLHSLVGQPSFGLRVVAVVVSFVVAIGSWKFIEQPVRTSSRISNFYAVVAYGICTLLLAGVSLYIAKRDGLPSRLSGQALATIDDIQIEHQSFATSLADVESGTLPRIGSLSVQPTFLIWGDSHALAASEVISRYAAKHNVGGWIAATGGNPPLLGVRQRSVQAGRASGMRNRNEAVLKFIRENKVQHVFLVAAWYSYTDEDYIKLVDQAEGNRQDDDPISFGLGQTIESLKASTRQIVILRQPPVQAFDVGQMRLNQVMFGWPSQLQSGLTAEGYAVERRRMNSVFSKLANQEQGQSVVSVLDPISNSFDDDGNSRLIESGVSFYVDTNHLTSKGVESFYGEAIDRILQSVHLSGTNSLTQP